MITGDIACLASGFVGGWASGEVAFSRFRRLHIHPAPTKRPATQATGEKTQSSKKLKDRDDTSYYL